MCQFQSCTCRQAQGQMTDPIRVTVQAAQDDLDDTQKHVSAAHKLAAALQSDDQIGSAEAAHVHASAIALQASAANLQDTISSSQAASDRRNASLASTSERLSACFNDLLLTQHLAAQLEALQGSSDAEQSGGKCTTEVMFNRASAAADESTALARVHQAEAESAAHQVPLLMLHADNLSSLLCELVKHSSDVNIYMCTRQSCIQTRARYAL
jgi:hypothetical protein